MIEAHATDPALHELLREVPHDEGARDLPTRLRGALRLAISSRSRAPRDLERSLFVLTHMIDALSHAAVHKRPPKLSLAAAKEEAVRAVLAYVRA
jgi:hypothetical protein